MYEEATKHDLKRVDGPNNSGRAELLNCSKNSKNGNRIPLIISLNLTAPNLSKIMQKHWPILQINE